MKSTKLIEDGLQHLAEELAQDSDVRDAALALGGTVIVGGTKCILKKLSEEQLKATLIANGTQLGTAITGVLLSPPGLICLGVIAVGGILYAIDNLPEPDTSSSSDDGFRDLCLPYV